MNKPNWFRPIVIFGVLCLIVLGLSFFYKESNLMRWIDGALFLILGLIGALLTFMWFGTDHIATKWNLNILWANPLYLLFFIQVIKRKGKYWKWPYYMALVTSALLLATFWGIFPQQYHIGVIPILIMMLVRSIFVLKKRSVEA